MANEADRKYMTRALELAARGRFKTAPNPMVGAVIVRGNRIIGEGYHRRAGGDHAEIVAIKNATEPVRGATIYVTLEPCCHTGRTGPCTDALISAGFKRVVFASTDPDRRVAGKGSRRLRRAGIKVEAGLLRSEAVRLNEIYFAANRLGRPFVILKTAQTLDGRIATATGDSRWVSGTKSLKFAHELRAEVDGVLVGAQTVRKDNPSLTVRRVKGPDPYRIILSRSLRFPRACHLLDNNADFKTIVAAPSEGLDRFARTKRGRNLIFWETRTDRSGSLNVRDLVDQAGRFGLRSLLIEGGGEVATAFLKAALVDKYIAIIAPKLLGHGIDAVGDMEIRRLANAITFDRTETFQSGDDTVFVGYPKWRRS